MTMNAAEFRHRQKKKKDLDTDLDNTKKVKSH